MDSTDTATITATNTPSPSQGSTGLPLGILLTVIIVPIVFIILVAAVCCYCCRTRERKRGAPVPQRKITDNFENTRKDKLDVKPKSKLNLQFSSGKLNKQNPNRKKDSVSIDLDLGKPFNVQSTSLSLPRTYPHEIPKTLSLPRMRNSDDIKTLRDTLSRLSQKNSSGPTLQELTLPRSSFGSNDHIPVKIEPEEAYEIRNIYELRKFDVEHVEYNQDRTSRQVSFVGSSAESDGGYSFIDSEI
ncbi:hypothetical protein HDV01_004595 [Terramyces sp. JEL0728]|nr:hypothetical protein HDV01_004595 [Terramyces sp. JEL0728]